jgi:peptidase E
MKLNIHIWFTQENTNTFSLTYASNCAAEINIQFIPVKSDSQHNSVYVFTTRSFLLATCVSPTLSSG